MTGLRSKIDPKYERTTRPAREAIRRREDLAKAYARKDGDFLISTLDDPDPDSRALAARFLGKMREQRAVGALLRCLTARSIMVRAAALDALWKIGDRSVIPRVHELTGEDEPFLVRTHAIKSLARLGDTGGRDMLVQIVIDPIVLFPGGEAVPRTRRWAARQLADIGAKEAIPKIQESRRNASFRTRLRLNRAIRRISRSASQSRPRSETGGFCDG